MKHRQINPDEAIDRFLAGLREAEPLDGMQQRVLRAAEDRVGTRSRWSLRLPFTPTHSWAMATGAAIAVTLAASWTIARSHRTGDDTARPPANLPRASAPAAEMYLASAPIVRHRSEHSLIRVSTGDRVALVEPVSDEDALARSEMNAPSQPAPPMPLTDQEKLLISLVQKGDPVELAMLDPKLRSSEETNSRADFDRFFPSPPLPIITPPNPNTNSRTGENK